MGRPEERQRVKALILCKTKSIHFASLLKFLNLADDSSFFRLQPFSFSVFLDGGFTRKPQGHYKLYKLFIIPSFLWLANGSEDLTKQQNRRKGTRNWICTGVTFVSCHEFSLQVIVQINEVLYIQSKWKKKKILLNPFECTIVGYVYLSRILTLRILSKYGCKNIP